MAINKNDLDFAKYVLDQAIYTQQTLTLNDLMLIRSFISALEEHFERPTENTASREWRAQVYRKLLDSPEALQQFTEQALQTFGIENLARMVAPDIQWEVVSNYFDDAPVSDVVEKLHQAEKLGDLVDYIIEHEPQFISQRLDIPENMADEHYQQGYADGLAEVETRNELSDDDIAERLERFANTPKPSGHYPSDAECQAYEEELRSRRYY